MIFFLLAISAVILYINDYKVSALFIFFFYITSGFNLVPEEATEFLFISKGSDYAFILLFGIIVIDTIFIKKYLHLDTFGKLLLIFGIFIAVCIVYSKTSVGLSFGEILRTSRYLFFWMAYFVFRNLTKEQLQNLLKILFTVTVLVSILYLMQIVIGKNILNETVFYRKRFLGINMWRFYNQPEMIHFFAIIAIYCNPYKGLWKRITTFILILTLLGGLHRSVFGVFAITIIIGYVLTLSRLQKMRIAIIASVFFFVSAGFITHKFTQSRMFTDLQMIASGNLADTDIDVVELADATFAFRIAHLIERNQYLVENPKAMIFGAGLIPEDSKKADAMFDFKIGLIEELTGNVVQLDSSDISYSVMILRFGYLGTILNLLLYIYLMVFFYKHKDNKYGYASFLYFVLVFGISLFLSNLVYPITFLLPLITYNIVRKEKKSSLPLNENISENEHQ